MSTINKKEDEVFIINLNDSVYDTISRFPEIADIMKETGFKSISEKGMIQTAGRFMSIAKGAKLKNIPIEKIIEAIEEKGYKVKQGGNNNE